MHVRYPKAIAYNPSNTFVDVGGSRYVEWYSTNSEWQEEEDNFSYFWEKRRPTFSDVFHAKLLTPDAGKEQGDPIGFSKWDRYIAGPGLLHQNNNPNSAVGCYRYQVKCTGKRYYYLSVRVWTYSGNKVRVTSTSYCGQYSHEKWGTHYATKRYVEGHSEYTYSGDVTSSYKTYYKVGDAINVQDVVTSTMRAFPNSNSYDNIRKIADAIARNLWKLVVSMANLLPDGRYYSLSTKKSPDHVKLGLGSDVFLLHEPDVLAHGYQDMFFGRGFEAYNRNLLIQRAYMNLIECVPRMSDNNISNLLEIIGFIKSLVIDKKIEIPKSLSDMWLSYRYQYSTTKMDVNEAIQFVRRNIDLGNWKYLKCYGRSTTQYEGISITCRAVAWVTPQVLSTVRKIWRSLYTYGLTPSFYVVWDMIPYSFIVDWFLPIGNILAVWDAEREFKQLYDVENVQFSITYDVPHELGTVHCYSRWLAGAPPELQGHYFFDTSASGKTIVKRILDTASLLIG